MQVFNVSDKETKSTFEGYIDRFEIVNGWVSIVGMTVRGKKMRIHLEEYEVSELVKQLKDKGLL